MKYNKIAISLLFVLVVVYGNVASASFSNFFVLGDSLSDIGNNASAELSIYNLLLNHCDPGHPCPPYYNGRFSNGRVTAEYLADAILPDGTNSANFSGYGIGGATTGIGNSGDGGSATKLGKFLLPGINFQLLAYLPNLDDNQETLHMVWGGGNDYLSGDSASAAARNITGIVNSLITAGAKNFLVPNLPDLSLTPYVQSLGLSAVDEAQNFSTDYNQLLKSGLDHLVSANPQTTIFQFDTFSLFNDVIKNPSAYGFTNVVDACITSKSICSDASAYVFWDDFHPTTRVHGLFASAMASSVPIPNAVYLFVLGAMAIFPLWQQKQ